MASQLRLGLERPPSYARDALVVTASNRSALAAMDAWPDWRGGTLALVGPAGSGKTHLSRIWAERLGATTMPASALDPLSPDGPVLVEDVDAAAAAPGFDGEALFHLVNRAARHGLGLLLTAREAPGAWPSAIPDLRSRLNALPVATLEPPDDDALRAMLDKFFYERNIRPSDELLSWLVRRIERSGDRAAEVVARLDEAASQRHRPVTRSLARLVLGDAEDEAPGE